MLYDRSGTIKIDSGHAVVWEDFPNMSCSVFGPSCSKYKRTSLFHKISKCFYVFLRDLIRLIQQRSISIADEHDIPKFFHGYSLHIYSEKVIKILMMSPFFSLSICNASWVWDKSIFCVTNIVKSRPLLIILAAIAKCSEE